MSQDKIRLITRGGVFVNSKRLPEKDQCSAYEALNNKLAQQRKDDPPDWFKEWKKDFAKESEP